jgi:hypothetical protein
MLCRMCRGLTLVFCNIFFIVEAMLIIFYVPIHFRRR